ncbi:hypothetical protein [Streptomyces sp. rh34]|uniref:hypothetical protein n=1 Tax=Streptomyces sp. rh34 TaxID=2034272 RepID=UPI001180DA12|nr:hypothetical protein [Streptomyces sp. rh34]
MSVRRTTRTAPHRQAAALVTAASSPAIQHSPGVTFGTGAVLGLGMNSALDTTPLYSRPAPTTNGAAGSGVAL